MSKLSARGTLDKLPLELRQIVYHLAAAGSTKEKEFQIKFTLSKDTGGGTGKLDVPPALDLFRLLHQVSRDLHKEALDYLTSAIFYWVLISVEQPHMYLLRAWRKYAPAYVLARIRNVSVLGSTFLGHTCPAPLTIVKGHFTDNIDALLKLRGEYIHDLGPNYKPKKKGASVYASKAKNDVAYCPPLLTLVFPRLSRINLELEIADCIYSSYVTYDSVEQNLKSPSGYWGRQFGRLMMEIIAGIGAIRSTSMVDIHIFWKDLGIQERFEEWEVDDETNLALKQSFIEHARTKLVAKSITGHV